MGFRLVLNSMTLNDLDRRNSPYFAFFVRQIRQIFRPIISQWLNIVSIFTKPPKGTALADFTRFEPLRVQIRSGVFPLGVTTKKGTLQKVTERLYRVTHKNVLNLLCCYFANPKWRINSFHY